MCPGAAPTTTSASSINFRTAASSARFEGDGEEPLGAQARARRLVAVGDGDVEVLLPREVARHHAPDQPTPEDDDLAHSPLLVPPAARPPGAEKLHRSDTGTIRRHAALRGPSPLGQYRGESHAICEYEGGCTHAQFVLEGDPRRLRELEPCQVWGSQKRLAAAQRLHIDSVGLPGCANWPKIPSRWR